jgi:sporulation related protein
MKLMFLILLLADLALFAIQGGILGPLPDSGREPERVEKQIEPDRIRVLSDDEARALRDKARQVAAVSIPGVDLTSGSACVEFGDFANEGNLGRIKDRLAALDLGERIATRNVDAPGWFMVYIPPFKTRPELDRAVDDLRNLGVKDLAVIGDNTPLRNGISLGSFRDPDLATKHLTEVEKLGVKGARVAERPSSAIAATRFRITSVDMGLAQKLAAIQKDYPRQKLMACDTAPTS